MRPVIRGTEYAVVSMKPQSTQAAERILRAGGNAFDAIVAGQAVLSLVDFALNGVGSDAVILVYDARSKQVYSINAEGTSPKLATIEWYMQNKGGRIPVNDTLLSGTVPGVVDAWTILLERWGTMSFAQVLQPAIDLAENGFPVSDSLARALSTTKKLRQYPSSVKLLRLDGAPWQPGEIFKNPDRTCLAC
jgi:gamma-glutamyltranspeptidase/glutathione hydrolase